MSKKQLEIWINQEIEAIQNIPLDGNIEKAAGLIHRITHKKTGKVIVSGVGKAGNIGMKIASTLCSTGTTAVFLPPLEAQHGELGMIQANDLLFLISNSGKTREIIELVQQSKKLFKDIKIIIITGNDKSPLAKLGEVVISTGKTKEICPLGLTPTTSTTVITVIGDLLVVYLMQKIGFTKNQYGLRHHSGYLGKKAKL